MQIVWRIFRKRTSRMVGFVLLWFFIAMALAGPLVYPHMPAANPAAIYLPPSWVHPLGTDYAGRDIWQQIVLGTRNVLYVAGMAAIFTVCLGTVIGLTAGYLGGLVDAILMRVTDIFLTIPAITLQLVLAVTIGMSNYVVMAALLSFASWAGLARAIRSMVFSVRERSFVEVSRGLGMPNQYIVFKEIFPNLLPYVIVHLMLALTSAVYGETGLFFLGVVAFKADNWGAMLNFAIANGALYTTQSVLFIVSPILAIVLLQTGIVLCMDAVNELADPRLRSASGGAKRGSSRIRPRPFGRIPVGSGGSASGQ